MSKEERQRAVAVICGFTGRCVADISEEEIDTMRNTLHAVLPQRPDGVAVAISVTEAMVKKGFDAMIEHEQQPLDSRHWMRKHNLVRAVLEGALMGDPPMDVEPEYFASLPIVESPPASAVAEPDETEKIDPIILAATRQFGASYGNPLHVRMALALEAAREAAPQPAQAATVSDAPPFEPTDVMSLAGKHYMKGQEELFERNQAIGCWRVMYRAWLDSQSSPTSSAQTSDAELRAAAERARKFLADSVRVYEQQSEDEDGGYASQWDHDADDIVAELSIALAPSPATEFPECSGDPASCPENEGYGCCQVAAPAPVIPESENDHG